MTNMIEYQPELETEDRFIGPFRNRINQAPSGQVNRKSKAYVKWVQQSLNKIIGLRLAVDGIIGLKTRSAIRDFQRRQGLSVDGRLGAKVEQVLINAGATSPPSSLGHTPDIYSATSLPATVSSPSLLKRESHPPANTLYVDIRLESEPPARPMTGIFFPTNYSLRKQVDLIVYLHGYKRGMRGVSNNVSIDQYWNSQRFPYWPLREGINESGKNVILVAPTLGPKSQAGRLMNRKGFDWYLNQLIKALRLYGPHREAAQTPEIGNIILACHSGSGRHMRGLALSQQHYTSHIRECWGFDCMYSERDPKAWAWWAKSHPAARLFMYYHDRSRSPKINSRKLATEKLPNVFVQQSTARDHFWVPITHWKNCIQNAGFLSNR